ncbi:hypothetical protein L1987_71260 [Smallanthus sonchifolius]|uniref:Uncharacterized protein n=1 Tax=Smallanthus sonchifolius TaxID=185202 RepID=A0ACB9ARB8_9ASTR|nr:hypothetical protein L1987_71260 [Smallanthus sonchifolius]
MKCEHFLSDDLPKIDIRADPQAREKSHSLGSPISSRLGFVRCCILRLFHAESSKAKSLKILVKGPSPSSRPSYKNFRVSSSSSSDDARRKGENEDGVTGKDNVNDDDVVGDNDFDAGDSDSDFDAGNFSLAHNEDQENVVGKDKGKCIMEEEEDTPNV